MLTAFVKNDVIEMIKDVSEDEYALLAPPYQVAIDISNITPVPEIGWRLVGVSFVNSDGVPSHSGKRITKLALRNRFTFQEKVILEMAMTTSNELKAWYKDYEVATYIDLARVDTIQGVQYLEYAGLLGAGRANQILNAPITEEEKW